MILGRYLLKELLLNIKLPKHAIEADDGPFIVYTAHMVDLGAYVFKYLNISKIKPEEYFTGAYVKELYES